MRPSARTCEWCESGPQQQLGLTTVIFLVGLVAMFLMRTLRKDHARYIKEEEDMENLF